jgi:hypothetical protein
MAVVHKDTADHGVIQNCSDDTLAPNHDMNQISSDTIVGDTSLVLQPHSNPLPSKLSHSLDRIGAAFFTSSSTFASSDKEKLANFAKLTPQDRMTVVEGEIVKLVTDENFVTLCQDVFGCWQRIGLDP